MAAQATAVPDGAAAGMAGQAGAAADTLGQAGAAVGMAGLAEAGMVRDGTVPIGDGAHGPITGHPIMAAMRLRPHRALRVHAASQRLSTLL